MIILKVRTFSIGPVKWPVGSKGLSLRLIHILLKRTLRTYVHITYTNRMRKLIQNIYTHKHIPFLSTGSTIEVQGEDGGPWMHGTMVGHGIIEHKDKGYKYEWQRPNA